MKKMLPQGQVIKPFLEPAHMIMKFEILRHIALQIIICHIHFVFASVCIIFFKHQDLSNPESYVWTSFSMVDKS